MEQYKMTFKKSVFAKFYNWPPDVNAPQRGMNMQSEVCLWTLLGLFRTIFDATLFKVNANLKQVWQMTMPEELSMPVQRVLRTMISGVMLVQCFTVYVYLASYIVLLYPVFLEERPTLVLPWLLLAAIRKLLCELTSLALGLGTCVLLGPARPPCIKFVIVKVSSIMPSFYMWMLVYRPISIFDLAVSLTVVRLLEKSDVNDRQCVLSYSIRKFLIAAGIWFCALLIYYHALKVASVFKTFPVVLPPSDHDYGLELAVRRRCTKSLLGEEQLRRKLVANFYGERISTSNGERLLPLKMDYSSRMVHSTDTSIEEVKSNPAILQPLSATSNRLSDTGSNDDWFGHEVVLPRDTDRILEQFVLMMLRIGLYLKESGLGAHSQSPDSQLPTVLPKHKKYECADVPADDTDTPSIVGSSKGNTASYLREYPQIFMKRSTDIPLSERKIGSIRTVQSQNEKDAVGNTIKSRKRMVTVTSNEKISLEIEKVISQRKSPAVDKNMLQRITTKKPITVRSKFRQNSKSNSRNPKASEMDLKQEYKENQRASTSNNQSTSTKVTSSSIESIKSLIEKGKNHLPDAKRSLKEDNIKIQTDSTSSSYLLDESQSSSRNSKIYLNKDKSGS